MFLHKDLSSLLLSHSLSYFLFVSVYILYIQNVLTAEHNAALLKKAWQSSDIGPNNPASLAVDESPTSCSRTSDKESQAEWTIDLEKSVMISRFIINTGSEFFGQNFEIHVSKDEGSTAILCGYGSGDDEIKSEYEVSCFTGPMLGRFVTIKNRFTSGVKICDIKILVCDDGYFGTDCARRCNCADVACARDTGRCETDCIAGWTGANCQQECPEGQFGANCRLTCHCMYGVTCDRVTGDCSTGCAESWLGPMCQTAIPRLVKAPWLVSAKEHELSIQWESWKGFVDGSLSLSYQIQYKLNDFHGNSTWENGPVVLDTDDMYEWATIDQLSRNSFYEFRIVPVIKIGEDSVRGGAEEMSPSSSTFRTKCHVPVSPNITGVEVWTNSERDKDVAGFTVHWTTLTKEQSNCDNIQFYEVLFQAVGDSTDSWQKAMAVHSASSRNVSGLKFGERYRVMVVAHNNQPLNSSSAIALITTEGSAYSVRFLAAMREDVGVITGLVVCGTILCAIIIVLVLLKKRMTKYSTVPIKDPDDKANAKGNHSMMADSGCIVASTTEISPLSVMIDSGGGVNSVTAPPLMHPCTNENGRIDRIKEPPLTPVERFPIKVCELEKYVLAGKRNNSEELKKEYRQLPESTRVKGQSVGDRIDNRLKNRFINIIPYDHSRVILEKVEGDDDSDYINASYINGYKKPKAYIAAQGCNKWTIQDMWRMVWQENSHRIVMVTNLVEKGKTKCEVYWPETENEEKSYGDFGITLTDVERTADFVVRTFDVRHISSRAAPRNVKQFHYTTWPDHGVPTRASPIVAFRRKVRAHDQSHPGVVLVHCSAGVGRTGAFIALDSLLDQAVAEQQVDVYNFTCEMRHNRISMIQTVEQYIFVYDALLDALKAGNTVLTCDSTYKDQLKNITDKNLPDRKSTLEEQFAMLEVMCPRDNVDASSLGSVADNREKNRYQNILPADRHRPYLMTRVQGTNDYINAVFLDGYRKRNAYIITQMPLPHTVIDMWRMVYEHNCGTIVMLNPWNEQDESYGQYWPEENEECECGPFMIEAMTVERPHPHITVRELRLLYQPQSPQSVLKSIRKEEAPPRTVNHFQYHGWPRDWDIPESHMSLVSLLDMVERSQCRTGNHPVVIHCHDGVKQSGVYAVVSCLWERMKDEQEVDVFQCVRQLRYHRPQIIEKVEQYRFCHEMIDTYLEECSTYSNFR